MSPFPKAFKYDYLKEPQIVRLFQFFSLIFLFLNGRL